MDACSMMISQKTFVAYWIKTDQLVILHKALFGAVIEFDHGIYYQQCELGPESDFKILGIL